MDRSDYSSFAPSAPLAAGVEAPDFTLHSTPDQCVSLGEFRGQPVIDIVAIPPPTRHVEVVGAASDLLP